MPSVCPRTATTRGSLVDVRGLARRQQAVMCGDGARVRVLFDMPTVCVIRTNASSESLYPLTALVPLAPFWYDPPSVLLHVALFVHVCLDMGALLRPVCVLECVSVRLRLHAPTAGRWLVSPSICKRWSSRLVAYRRCLLCPPSQPLLAPTVLVTLARVRPRHSCWRRLATAVTTTLLNNAWLPWSSWYRAGVDFRTARLCSRRGLYLSIGPCLLSGETTLTW